MTMSRTDLRDKCYFPYEFLIRIANLDKKDEKSDNNISN